jgi:hypothetical protein
MRLFSSKKRLEVAAPPPALPPGARTVDAATLIRAVPHLHPQVERISDRRHGCLLSWPIARPARRRPPSLLGRLFSAPARKRRLVLDDLGRRTVELIDGRRSLAVIAARLSQETGHTPADMEAAVLAFVSQLVRRNAAALVAPQD